MTEAAKQQTAEEYVRSRWEQITVRTHRKPYWIHLPYWIQSRFEYLGQGPFVTENEMWSAAHAFTLEREEQIRQVEEEIREINSDIAGLPEGNYYRVIFERILAREQAALAELKKGMK